MDEKLCFLRNINLDNKLHIIEVKTSCQNISTKNKALKSLKKDIVSICSTWLLVLSMKQGNLITEKLVEKIAIKLNLFAGVKKHYSFTEFFGLENFYQYFYLLKSIRSYDIIVG